MVMTGGWFMIAIINYPLVNLLHSYGKIHHFERENEHYFDWAMLNSYVVNDQRVQSINVQKII